MPVSQLDSLDSTPIYNRPACYTTRQPGLLPMCNRPGPLHNQTAWTPSRCITGQPITQPDTLSSAPMYNQPTSISWLLAHCATGLKYILMITMNSYRYLTFKNLTISVQIVVMRCLSMIIHPTLLCNGPSGCATGHQGMHPDKGWASVQNIYTP